MEKPIAIDLFCGLGGWTDGLLSVGWDVVGFDIERHRYEGEEYKGILVIQDVLTLHGAQFRDADLIVASPPCQAYSYMAMPWALAKEKAAAIRADTTGKKLAELNALFDACFRLQREACEAAGRYIPMVVENVRGAIPWVGRSRWNYGSFHLWGDVPALMPITDGIGGTKVKGFRFDGTGRSFQGESVRRLKDNSYDGIKVGGDWFNAVSYPSRMRGSRSSQRKRASALIAKIPLPLSRHIALSFFPKTRINQQALHG